MPPLHLRVDDRGSAHFLTLWIGQQTFFWGRTKSSGEATMYPKPVYDLNGT
jgi:hypothetical protein